MSISNKNDRFTLIIDKELKSKINSIAQFNDRSMSNYVYKQLEKHVKDFENDLFKKYGKDDFMKYFRHIFGENLEPHPHTKTLLEGGFYFEFDDDENAKLK